MARFVNDNAAVPILWVAAHHGKNLIRDTLDLLQEEGSISRWRELFGRFQIWTGVEVAASAGSLA